LVAVKGGLLLIGAGLWVLAQIFAGDALGRLGIAGAPTKPNTTPPGVGGGSGLGGDGQSGGGAGGGGGSSW
jgi:hypothetical protein